MQATIFLTPHKRQSSVKLNKQTKTLPQILFILKVQEIFTLKWTKEEYQSQNKQNYLKKQGSEAISLSLSLSHTHTHIHTHTSDCGSCLDQRYPLPYTRNHELLQIYCKENMHIIFPRTEPMNHVDLCSSELERAKAIIGQLCLTQYYPSGTRDLLVNLDNAYSFFKSQVTSPRQ